jgi:hypothetical protein
LAFQLICLLLAAPRVLAASPTIPIYGKFATLTIGIEIPSSPRWAHDVVLNAAEVWNRAQVWYCENFQDGPVYTFVEVARGNTTVSFDSLPPSFVGLTSLTFSSLPPNSLIDGVAVGGSVQLSNRIFNEAEVGNTTNSDFAFHAALHELGHVLGLEEMLGGPDIMNMFLQENAGYISTLDLYAIRYLAALPARTNPPTMVTLPATVPYRLVGATTFLDHQASISTHDIYDNHDTHDTQPITRHRIHRHFIHPPV